MNLSPCIVQAQQLVAQCQLKNTRAMFVITGPRNAAQSGALNLLKFLQPKLKANVIHWVADDVPVAELADAGHGALCFAHVHRAQAQKLLGNETTVVVMNGHDGFNANVMAAISGTLVGGGILILLAPELTLWPAFADPDYQRMRSNVPVANAQASCLQGNFLTRMVRFINVEASLNRFMLVLASGDIPRYAWPSAIEQTLSEKPTNAIKRTAQLVEPDSSANNHSWFVPTADQQAIVGAAEKLSEQVAGAILITAARGRGKTTALAFSLSKLLQTTQINVVVVAPHRNNVNVLFSTLQNMRELNNIDVLSRVIYRPADALLLDTCSHQKRASAGQTLLVVDEAAGLAVSLLNKLDSVYPLKIMASTTQGYEGSGRGFLLRFKQQVVNRAQRQSLPQSPGKAELNMQHIELSDPIRWAAADPLESFTNKLMCLHDTSSPIDLGKSQTALHASQGWVIEKIEKIDLLASESLLQSVFSLLVAAHYQTQPNDLRFTLDTPFSHLWVARNPAGLIVGVLLAVAEGGYPTGDPLTAAIVQGRRRPRGNLLAQRLANHSGESRWCTENSLRIMRVAVTKSARRKRVASQLIQAMKQWGHEADFDYWSSSFGYERSLCEFWAAAGALPVYVGMHLDKASGSRNVMLAGALKSCVFTEAIESRATALLDDIQYWFPRFLPEMEEADIEQLKIWARSSTKKPRPIATGPSRVGEVRVAVVENSESVERRSADHQCLVRFVHGEIDVAAVFPALCRYGISTNAQASQGDDQGLLQDYIRFAPDWRQLGQIVGVDGQRLVVDKLRNICRQLTQTPN
jgi:tRNA(Met) cytidine acetyltransferase